MEEVSLLVVAHLVGLLLEAGHLPCEPSKALSPLIAIRMKALSALGSHLRGEAGRAGQEDAEEEHDGHSHADLAVVSQVQPRKVH